MKKKICILLVFAALLSLLVVGCKEKSSTYEVKTKSEQEPWSEDGVKVTWWLMGGVEEYYQYYWSEMKCFKEIQGITGIDIDFEVAINYEAYLPMMSAKTYPHIITAKNNEKYAGRLAAMYADGVSQSLNRYIDEGLMPNFKKILDENPDIARELRLNDGTYSYLTRIYDTTDENQRALTSTYGLVIRQDWLDKVDKEVPTNIAEWYDVLKAFRTGDPNGNGVADEEPYIACSSGWKYFMPAYGIDDDPSLMTDENGNPYVVYGYVTENYKRYLEEMNKWYEEELLYHMFENVSLEYQRDRVTNNFAGSWKGAIANIEADKGDSFINVLKKSNPKAALTAVPWPKTEDGTHWCFSDISSVHRDTTVITSNAVKDGVDEAAAFLLDYMLSEEGTTLLTWGIEGESYEVVGGEKQLVEGMDEMVDFHGQSVSKIYTYADATTIAFPTRGDIVADYILGQKPEEYVEACKTWATGDTSYKIQQTCQLSVDQQTEADVMQDEMLNYMSKMRNRFVTGQIPLTNYDSYVEQCNLLRADVYTEIWQEAYDNYCTR